jgi:hypothetical protein
MDNQSLLIIITRQSLTHLNLRFLLMNTSSLQRS